MSEHKITVEGGTSVRLPTAGKYCDRDIVVAAEGGGVELPVLDRPATEEDIARGKQAIDADGNVIAGQLTEYPAGHFLPYETEEVYQVNGGSDGKLYIMTELNRDILFREGGGIDTSVPATLFGDATADDVAKGKTFTSKAGLVVEGTKEAGVELPTLTSPASEADVAERRQFIDARGAKKTGTLPTNETDLYYLHDIAEVYPENGKHYIVGIPPEDILLRAGLPLFTELPVGWMGDAQPGDVVAGKTFTSKAGFRQTGTLAPQTLPTLNNPAGENDVRRGKAYIGADGELHYGMLYMDGVYTPDWSTFVPVHIGYDSDDRYLVMDNLDGVGVGGGLETVEIAMCDYMNRGLYVYYTDGNGRIQYEPLQVYDITIEAAKNTIICIEGYSDDIYPVDCGGEYSPVGDTWNVRKLTFTFGSNGYIRIATA